MSIGALRRACESAQWIPANALWVWGIREAPQVEIDVEIERKFLLTEMPELDSLPANVECERLEVEQGWLPGERIRERLRRTIRPSGTDYTRTLKFGSGLVRQEVEEAMSIDLFESMWPLTQGRRVRKIRWVIRQDGKVWELDEFIDRDLVLLEVELSDVHEQVTLPSWATPLIDREVTDEPEYTNHQLAR